MLAGFAAINQVVMLPAELGSIWVLLHISVNSPFIPRPAESHHVFGAGFILLGSLMTAESLGGEVWYRSKLRAMFFPATLILLGCGMLAVTFIEPRARIAHLAMALPMTIGGWSEAQYRLGQMQRVYADRFIALGLLFAALETVMFHLGGAVTSGGFLTHAGLAITAVIIAFLRLYQGGAPTSVTRSLLVSAAVLAVGVVLFSDASFQR